MESLPLLSTSRSTSRVARTCFPYCQGQTTHECCRNLQSVQRRPGLSERSKYGVSNHPFLRGGQISPSFAISFDRAPPSGRRTTGGRLLGDHHPDPISPAQPREEELLTEHPSIPATRPHIVLTWRPPGRSVLRSSCDSVAQPFSVFCLADVECQRSPTSTGSGACTVDSPAHRSRHSRRKLYQRRPIVSNRSVSGARRTLGEYARGCQSGLAPREHRRANTREHRHASTPDAE